MLLRKICDFNECWKTLKHVCATLYLETPYENDDTANKVTAIVPAMQINDTRPIASK